MICYLFLNVLKVEISKNLRFLRTNVVCVVALSAFCDDYRLRLRLRMAVFFRCDRREPVN
jgi:hypothetical protein